jgi:RHS repeat-associated protein
MRKRCALGRDHSNSFRANGARPRRGVTAMRKVVAAVAEPLESRILLTAISWNGGTGNWNAAANWTPAQIPGYGDDVTIAVAGSVVNVDDSERASTVTTSAGTTFNLNAGAQILIDNGGTISGGLKVAAAQDATGAAQLNTGSFTSLVLGGATTLAGDLIGGHYTNSGTMTVDGGALGSGVNLANNATMNVTNGFYIGNSCVLVNGSAGTVDLQDDTAFSGAGTITNAGLFEKTAGTGTTIIPSTMQAFEDTDGTISVQTGELSDQTGAYLQGTTFNIGAGASFGFDDQGNGIDDRFSGTISGTGTGHVLFDSQGAYNENFDRSLPATSILDFPAGMAQVTGFTFASNGGAGIVNTGFLNYVGSAGHADAALDNQGTIDISGAGSFGIGNVGDFTNDTTGVIDFQADASIVNNGGNTAFFNDGTIEKTAGTGISSIGGNVNALGYQDTNGIINARSGTIDFPQAGSFTATTFNAGAGANISFDDTAGGTVYSFSGAITGSGAGNVIFAASGVNDPDVATTLNFPQGFAQVTGGAFTVFGLPIVNIGYLSYVGSGQHGDMGLDNQGTIDVTGLGTLIVDSNGGFTNDTTGILDFQSDADIASDGGNTATVNMGLIEKTAGIGISVIGFGTNAISFQSLGGSYSVKSGTLSLQNDGGDIPYDTAALHVAAGATFDLGDGAGGVIYMSGTLSMTGGGRVTLSGALAGPRTDIGTNAAPGVVDFAPGQLFVTGGGFVDSTGLTNLGTVDATGGGVFGGIINDGTITFGAGPIRISGNLINAPDGTFNFTASQQVLALGNNGIISNQGTMNLDAGSGTLDLSQNNMTNSGTINFNSGTILLPWIPNQYVFQPGLFPTEGGLPAGSTFVIGAGVTVNVSTAPHLAILDGTLILGGAGASIPAFASLLNINGDFEVDPGAIFSTAASLSNSGTIVVGGQLTVNGNFNEAQAQNLPVPTLQFAIGGAPDSADAPSFTVTGTATLTGNLTATYANGFAATGGTMYTVANFQGPIKGALYTGGIGPLFTVAVNSTSIILTASALAAADLDVTSVTAPTTFSPGDNATIGWTVVNNGGPATGSWVDSVYLTTTGTIRAADILLGRVTHTGGLDAGAEYAPSLHVNLPAVAAGSYQIVVLADSGDVVPDVNRANNLGVAAASTAVNPSLTVGTATNSTIVSGQSRVYSLTLAAGQDINLTATFASGGEADVFTALGGLPTSTTFDSSLTSSSRLTQSLVLHAATAGVEFILVSGKEAAGATPQSFSLEATLSPYGPTVISPSSGNNAGGSVTVTVSGSGFNAATSVTLVSGGTNVGATHITLVDSNTLYATFILSGVAPGVYGLQVSQGSSGPTATVPAAFTVAAGNSGSVATSPGELEYYLSAPAFIRAGSGGTITLSYANDGGTEIPAPLFEITSDNANFEFAGEKLYVNGAIDVLGTSPTGPAGVLEPGASGIASINFQQVTTGGHVNTNFNAYVFKTGTATDWDALKSEFKPATASQAGWDQTWANFESLVGTTAGSYQAELDNVATAMGVQGTRSNDASVYFSQIIQVAGDFGQIELRNAFSDFGYGQTDPYDAKLGFDSMGNAAIGNGENLRYFDVLADGTFEADDPSDLGVLTHDPSGAYTLTEADGSKTRFNANGTLNSFVDAHGNKTQVTLSNGYVTALTDAFGGTTTIARKSNGMIKSVTDTHGNVTNFTYDSSGNLLAAANSAGTTTFTYATPANHEVTEISNPNGTDEFFTYDSFARLDGESFGGGAGLTTLTYDDAGNETVTDADHRTTSVTRGTDGDVTAIRDALGNVLSLNYSGGSGVPAAATDAMGLETSSTTDAAGDVTAIISPSGAKVSVVYNSKHQPTSLTDANGHTTSFTYDANGNLLASTDAAGHVTRNTYTAQSLLKQSTSAAGRVVNNTYNSSGQLTGQTFSDGTSATYGYDAHGNLISATNASGTDVFTYNSANQLTNVNYSDGLSLAYGYNSHGQLSQTVDQTGFTTKYAYNAQGQLDLLTDASGHMVAAYTYDLAGNLTRTDLGNGAFTLYGYDSDGRLNSVVNMSAGGLITSSFSYTFDANSRILTMTTLAGTTSYTYNADGELASAVLPGGRNLTWSYDAAGNLASTTDSGGTAAAYTVNNLNEYSTNGATTYAYDADGNLISSTNAGVTTTYTYNVLEQLTKIAGPSGTTKFTYDALGNRVAETVSGVTTDLLVDPTQTNGLAGEFTTGGGAVAQFVFGLGLVGESNASAAVDYYSFDIAGNVAAVTGTGGAVLNSYTYLPFGQTVTSTGTTPNPFTFDGRDGVLSAGNGNYLTRSRLYSSTTGRFTQRDLLGFTGGTTNLYQYAGNDPVDHIDPSGGFFIGVLGFQGASALAQSQLAVASAVVRGAVSSGANAFISTVEANTGAFIDASGALLESAAPAVTTAGPLTFAPTAVSVTGATAATTTTNVVLTGFRTVAAADGSLAIVPAVSALVTTAAVVLPVVTIAAITNRQAISDQINKTYFQTYEPEPSNYEALHPDAKKKLIETLSKDPLGQTLLANTGVSPASLSLATLTLYAQTVARNKTQSVTSHDPNEIIGPSGFGTALFVPGGAVLPYTIGFTNEASASAPAAVVTITEQVNAKLDWSTFQLGNISFGSTTIAVPPGQTQFSKTLNMVPTLGVDVRIVASFDNQTGLATWTFTSLDPATQDIPANPLLGFLPPDDSTGRGEGVVSYSIKPAAADVTGQKVKAQATIVFDDNSPISTANISNSIDVGAPTSTVTSLPVDETTSTFPLSWTGHDDAGGSGIAFYTVYESEDGGTFTPLLVNTTTTSTTFIGSPGHSYGFYTVAADNVGNVQPTPTTAQATTTVSSDIATLEPNGALEVLGGMGNDTIVLTSSGKLITATINGTAQTPIKAKKVLSILVDAGDGNDSVRIAVGFPATSVTGDAGNDTLIGHNSGDTLSGGQGSDSLQATGGNNSLVGGNGRDTIIAGSGNDTLVGGKGADSLVGGPGNDSLSGGPGADTILGSSGPDSGTDTINGGVGDVITGTKKRDLILG